MDRRTFISLTSSLLSLFPGTALLARRQIEETDIRHQLEEPWQTLAVVMEHLFPATADSPGASDIQALDFLQNMMNTPDADQDEKEFIIKGVGWLNGIASKSHQRNFIDLNEQQKESVLRQIEQSQAGERWLSRLLSYLIEALLSDPVYGGNPEGIGWRWLEHQPGFPRPGADKVYYKLGKTTYRRTKA